MIDHKVEFSKRLNQALDEKGIPERGRTTLLSKQFSVTPKAANKWLNGESMPETEKLINIALWLGKSIEWLLTGKQITNNTKHQIPTAIIAYEDGDLMPDGYVALNFYKDVNVSAGDGFFNSDYNDAQQVYFPLSLIELYQVNSDLSTLVVVDGDSMFPDLHDGQIISIDGSAKKIFDGEIYAFVKNNEIKIKMLFEWNEEGKGGFKAVSRNPDKVRYPDEYYSPTRIEAENIYILGQYWWKFDARKVRR